MSELDQGREGSPQRSTRAVLGQEAGDCARTDQERLARTALSKVEILVAQGCGRQAARYGAVQQFLIELVNRLPKGSRDRSRGAEEMAGRRLHQSVKLPTLGRRRSLEFEIEKEEVVNPTAGRSARCPEGQGPGRRSLTALPTRDVHQSDIGLEGLSHGGYFTDSVSSRQSCCKFQTCMTVSDGGGGATGSGSPGPQAEPVCEGDPKQHERN